MKHVSPLASIQDHGFRLETTPFKLQFRHMKNQIGQMQNQIGHKEMEEWKLCEFIE